jgi:DNA-binding MarR family transcriptional regulator
MLGQIEAQAFQQEGFSDLTMRQLLYLETIDQMDNPTFSQLAEELNVTLPSVSVLVKKLIDLGYFKKIQSEQDGRVYHLELTPTGNRMAQLHNQINRWLAKKITSNLNERELHNLSQLLGKIEF